MSKFNIVVYLIKDLLKMVSKRFVKHRYTLGVLKSAKPKLRNAIIENGGNDLVYCICECIQNVLNYNIKLTDDEKTKMKK